jgi:hypothetical protein
MPNPLRKLPFQYQSQGKRMGGDEPPEASMRKGKAGRTKPSSRVKKKKKSGQSGFIGPRKFKDELAEDQTARHKKRIERYEKEDLETGRGKRNINEGVSHLRFVNDEVPIGHNVGVFRDPDRMKGARKRRRGRFPGGVNEEPYVNPREGLQSERLQRLITLLEKKLLSKSKRKIGVNDENFSDEQYYSGTGESMNDLSYERYLNRG